MTRSAPPSCRLRVEALEEREVPAIFFGVTTSNVLVNFDSANPSVILRSTPITGFLSPGEVITDIDVRPATGGLYGFSNFDRLYLINPFNAFAYRSGTRHRSSPSSRGSISTRGTTGCGSSATWERTRYWSRISPRW